MTLEQVQRAMAASHPQAPAPPAATPPVEKPDPAPAKAVTRTIETASTASTRSRVRKAAASSTTTETATAEKLPTTGPAEVGPHMELLATDVPGAPVLVATAVTTPAPDLFPGPQVASKKTAGLQFSDDPRIYSKDDADVVPARLLTGQNGAAVTNTVTDINTMELVISKMGRVETAKLSTPPKRMTDMLLLSGAKMWRFTPALKDGQPVRYRTMVSYETIR